MTSKITPAPLHLPTTLIVVKGSICAKPVS